MFFLLSHLITRVRVSLLPALIVFLIKLMCSNLLMGGGRSLVSVNSCGVMITQQLDIVRWKHRRMFSLDAAELTHDE